MEFIASVMEAVIKMAVILALAFAGGVFGKKMRDRKNEKAASDNE
jgi:hypothetical protein